MWPLSELLQIFESGSVSDFNQIEYLPSCLIQVLADPNFYLTSVKLNTVTARC